jgi:hypothetical protein
MVEDRTHNDEMEILVPGPFVVLQGNTGDGLSNTIDGRLPNFIFRRTTVSRTARGTREGGGRRQLPTVTDGELVSNEADEGANADTTDAMIVDSSQSSSSPASSLSSQEEEEFQHVARNTAAGIVNGPRYAVTAGVVAAAAAAENNDGNTSSSSDEFVVVADEDNNNNENENETPHPDRQQQQQPAEEELAVIETWIKSRRRNELQQRNDWEESLYQVPPEIKSNHAMMTRAPTTIPNNDPQSRSWWQRNGEVAVLRELPTKLVHDGSVAVNRIGTLPPGMTIVANDLIELNSITLLPIATKSSIPPATPNRQRSFSQGRVGIIQMIKVETKEGRTGYACLSLDGYPLLAPGLPDAYVNPGAPNIWRVTCPSGAFVREGLDLRTRHTKTLPYGSLVRVSRRCINDQGLSRLRPSGYFDLQTTTRGASERNGTQPSAGRRVVLGTLESVVGTTRHCGATAALPGPRNIPCYLIDGVRYI